MLSKKLLHPLINIQASFVLVFSCATTAYAGEIDYGELNNEKAALGNILFNDTQLSEPAGQSCATCHKPDQAFSDGLASSPGAVNGRVGKRSTPTLMYAKFSPEFEYVDWRNSWVGGQFWDGRSNTLAEQVSGPLFSNIEMNNSPEGLAKKLRSASYFPLIQKLYGKEVGNDDAALNAAAADALQQFQLTDTFAPFTSKFDYSVSGKVKLSDQEEYGKRLFNGKAMCIDCHSGIYKSQQTYSSFAHHNILTPANPELGFYKLDKNLNPDGDKYIDGGTGDNPNLSEEDRKKARGRFKTPTLRNIALTAPYMHNGVFKTLRETIEYYNDIEDRERWGPPEVAENKSTMLTSKLFLEEKDIEALLAFLNTLTDGYEIKSSESEGQEAAAN